MTADSTERPIENIVMLPCPFCGSPGTVAGNEFYGHSSFYATCTSVDCFCCVGEAWDRDACPDHQFATEQQAADAWNKRAT